MRRSGLKSGLAGWRALPMMGALLAALWLQACGAGSTEGHQQETSSALDSKWCRALSVFRESCQECHSAHVQSTAPMPLDTYADLMKPAVTDHSKKVYQLVHARIHDSKRPMPEPPRELTADQLAAIDDWIADGAQAGSDETCPAETATESDAGTSSIGSEWPADCEEVYKFTAGNGRAHVVKAGAEEHLSFYFDAPWGDEAVQAVAVRPVTDNRKVLHHWILYENSLSIVDAAAGGKFLAGWSPGKDGMRKYPEDVGLYLPSGKQILRLDVHYYNRGGTTDESDQSGLEICITRHFRKHTAGTFAFGNTNFSLAPEKKTDITTTCKVTTTSGTVYLMNSSPHMHKLGYWAKFTKTASDGKQTTLQDTSFNFEFQQGKDLGRVPLNSGDKMTTVCRYDNDTAETVTFGQNTEDEMCFNFAMYYPIDGFYCPPPLTP